MNHEGSRQSAAEPGARFRHARPPRQENELGQLREISRQQAIVVGIDGYPHAPLANATADAEALSELLSQDFAFDLLPEGRPMLDAEAGLSALQTTIQASLQEATATTRWLFYFAGHGEVIDGEGYLVPAGARPGEPAEYLELQWLVQRALESPAREILIILDACYAGQVFVRPEYEPWLEEEEVTRRGTLQILAAGGPNQTVADGGGQGHSVFTHALLEALRGEAGIHGTDGSVRFSPLCDFLDLRVEEFLGDYDGSLSQQLLGVTVRSSLDGSVRGDFRFKPKWPRLAPDLIQGLRSKSAQRRRMAITRLGFAFSQEPTTLREVDRWSWNLPLAASFARRWVPGGPLELLLQGSPPCPEAEWEVRREIAKTLGTLGEKASSFFSQSPPGKPGPITGPLTRLALGDQDPVVRRTAQKGLRRALGDADQAMLGRRLENLRRAAPGPLGRRSWWTAAALPGYRKTRKLGVRLAAQAAMVPLYLGDSWHSVARHRWVRGILLAAFLALALFFGALSTRYYFSTDGAEQVILLRGFPGLDGIPPSGRPVATTDIPVTDLADSRMVKNEPLMGFLFTSQDGLARWGHHLADGLKPHRAALAHWRLGNEAAALAELEECLETPQETTCITTLAYMSFQAPHLTADLLKILSRGLGHQDPKVQLAASRILPVIHGFRPEETHEFLQELVASRMEGSEEELPPNHLAVVLKALTLLGEPNPAAVEFAIRRTEETLRGNAGESDVILRILTTLDTLCRQRREPVALAEPWGAELTEVIASFFEAPTQIPYESVPLLLPRSCLGTDSKGDQLHQVLQWSQHPSPRTLKALRYLDVLSRQAPELLGSEIPKLLEIAQSSAPQTALAASRILVHLPLSQKLEARLRKQLSRHLFSDHPQEIRQSIFDVLSILWRRDSLAASLQDTEEIQSLFEITEDQDSAFRAQGTKFITTLALEGRIDPATVGLRLEALLSDESPLVREEAAQGLLLLGTALEDRYRQALTVIFTLIHDKASGEQFSRVLPANFSRASPEGTARFATALLRTAESGEPYFVQKIFQTLRGLAIANPPALPALAPELARQLSRTVVYDDFPWEITQYLRSLRRDHDLDLTGLSERFLTLAQSSSPRLRQGATRALGPVAAGGEESATRALASLARIADDAEPETAALAVESFNSLCQEQRSLRELAHALLLDLQERRSELRLPIARALAKGPCWGSKTHPDSIHELPESPLRDPSQEVRRKVAEAWVRWALRQPKPTPRTLRILSSGIRRERDLVTRLHLATARTIVSPEDAAAQAQLEDFLQAALKSMSEALPDTALHSLKRLGIAREELAPMAISTMMAARHDLPPSLLGLTVLYLREIGFAHPTVAPATVEALRQVLLDGCASPHPCSSALINALEPMAKKYPELSPKILVVIEEFQKQPFEDFVLQKGGYRAWQTVAAVAGTLDRELLWQKVSSSWWKDRGAAVRVLVRLVREHPALSSPIETRFRRLREGGNPPERLAASKGLEMLRLIRWHRKHAGSVELPDLLSNLEKTFEATRIIPYPELLETAQP